MTDQSETTPEITKSQARDTAPKPAAQPAKRSTPKTEELIRLLSGATARDVAYLSRKLGWQPHTTRAALTRLRKAGYEITVEKPDGKPGRYRITGAPSATPEAS